MFQTVRLLKLTIMKHPQPGPVFEHFQPILKEFRRERKVFSERKALSFGFFSVELEWLKTACEGVRAEERFASYPEFWEAEESEFFRVIHQMRLETISAGDASLLLLNTCPVAQIDFKGEHGMAEFFDLPAMSKEEWEYWEMLGAGTLRFEVLKNARGHLIVRQIKEEEGRLNTLKMSWTINLSTGDTDLSVVSELHRLPRDPTLENLIDWIDVRAGKTHPLALDQC